MNGLKLQLLPISDHGWWKMEEELGLTLVCQSVPFDCGFTTPFAEQDLHRYHLFKLKQRSMCWCLFSCFNYKKLVVIKLGDGAGEIAQW